MISTPAEHPSANRRPNVAWLIIGLIVAVLVIFLALAGFAVWLNIQPVAVPFDPGETDALMTAKDVVEVWYPDRAAEISIPKESQEYYKREEYDGALVLGYRCDYEQDDIDLGVVYETRTYDDSYAARAAFEREIDYLKENFAGELEAAHTTCYATLSDDQGGTVYRWVEIADRNRVLKIEIRGWVFGGKDAFLFATRRSRATFQLNAK